MANLDTLDIDPDVSGVSDASTFKDHENTGLLLRNAN